MHREFKLRMRLEYPTAYIKYPEITVNDRKEKIKVSSIELGTEELL